MDTWKRLGKALLWPPTAVLIPLLPLATALLVYAMVVLGTEHPVSYVSYVLSAYTLAIWCFRIPRMVAAVKRLKTENRLVKRWLEDVHWRMSLTRVASLIWNVAYAVFQLGLGVYHASVWYYAMAGYYASLAVMYGVLRRHTDDRDEDRYAEWRRYRNCGWIFLVMNVALTVLTLMTVFEQHAFEHGEIVTIAMAAYTFTAFVVAIVNVVRYRRYHSPVYSASKVISLATACVSMLTLSATMLTTFGGGASHAAFRTRMLGLIGGAVSIFVIVLAVAMIIRGTRQLRHIRALKNRKGTAHES